VVRSVSTNLLVEVQPALKFAATFTFTLAA